MKQYLTHDAWSIIEEGFHESNNKISESVFSLGNGRMGQRANFEEQYSGETLQGSYVAGVYYPDKTRVGWWKNGYPEYFAKVLNAPNWIGINVHINGIALDLHQCKVEEFRRELNMREGYLERSLVAELKNGLRVRIHAKRFCSIAQDEVGAIRYSITPLNFNGKIALTPYLDADVVNKDSNYDEKFWIEIAKHIQDKQGYIIAETKKTAFQVCVGMTFQMAIDGEHVNFDTEKIKKDKFVANRVEMEILRGSEVTIYKYGVVLSSENHAKENLASICQKKLSELSHAKFNDLLKGHSDAWAKKWEESDILIEGDIAAQQGIRFNIFQLNQTYTGEDARLNIGPKGFTGEKYGGSTYWDTEAYCLPFYLATADQRVARNLLIYRHNHLARAIENAAKLGFDKGAALYPMVTMNGEECHNEWEITFEEIHRNGAIAYGIYDYINYTGDETYLIDYGAEVLVGIARFWKQRIHWSNEKNQYVMLGVTGPNEYENNVNNNWYTNYIACWCLRYATQALQYVSKNNPEKYAELTSKLDFEEQEVKDWKHINDNMFYPKNDALGIYLQQEGYMDKEQILVKDLDKKHLPLNQKWSWDRILRSCFIKQADVLQGLYFFEDDFDKETLRRNFDFYEPRTVHESSLSPCVHSILAAKLGYEEKAYEMYLRTARLDLDDYNNDTEDGCHITSMAGSWMSVIKGFAGMTVKNDELHFAPFTPEKWESYAFKIRFRDKLLQVRVAKQSIEIHNLSESRSDVYIHGKKNTLAGFSSCIL